MNKQIEIETTLEGTINAIVARGWRFQLEFVGSHIAALNFMATVLANKIEVDAFDESPQKALEKAASNMHEQLDRLFNGVS